MATSLLGTKAPQRAKPPKLTIGTLVRCGAYVMGDPWVDTLFKPDFRRRGLVGEVTLFDLGDGISSADAVARIRQGGYQPANDLELLRYGNDHPDLPNSSTQIVALGSIWFFTIGGDQVLVLSRERGEDRKLYLRSWSSHWSDKCLFAAVRVS